MSRVKAIFGDDCHVERRMGKVTDAVDYCNKEDTRMGPFMEVGEMPEQGKRNDLLLCKRKLLEGSSVAQLFHDDETFCQAVKYHRGLLAAQEALQPIPQRDNVQVTALCGEPGLGKTRAVHQWEGDSLYVVDPPNQHGGAVWMDGYEGQSALLLDDYNGWLPWAFLLRLLDRYALRTQCKGSSRRMAATRIYLTSNKWPWQWHPHQEYGALQRRITTLWSLTFEGAFKISP